MFLIRPRIIRLKVTQPCNDCKWYVEPNNDSSRWACSYPGICCSPDGYKTAYVPDPHFYEKLEEKLNKL